MRIPLPALTALFVGAVAFLSPAHAGDPSTETPPPPKATYVLVHGAWGGGWAFKEVDRLLSADGSKVFRPTLTGLGEKNHLVRQDTNLTTHITDIVNLILWEDLHDVVLVGHSYGGMVITGVMDRVPDRIKRAVYLDAILPENGESVAMLRPKLSNMRTENGVIIPPWLKDLNAKPPHDVPHPAATLAEPEVLTNPEATAKIPVTYILTVDEGRQPPEDDFFSFHERAKARHWEVVIMTGDHNVQWSHPKELAALIKDSLGHATH